MATEPASELKVHHIWLQSDRAEGFAGLEATFPQAATVIIDVTAKNERGKVIPLPTDATCLFMAWIADAPETLYVNQIGTVIDGKTARVELDRDAANLPEGEYEFEMKVLNEADDETAMVGSGILTVAFSVNSEDAEYVGTSPSYSIDAGATAETNTALRLAPDGEGGVEWVAATSGVTSFNGRTGVVVPTSSDYTSGTVTNASDVTGATVTAALNALDSGKLGTSAQAADVNPAGTSIAAALLAKRAFKVESASFTALQETLHIVTANATATDPSPTQGQGYDVLVWNGTATVGGTAYALKGTVISRRYHSGAWTQVVSLPDSQFPSIADYSDGVGIDGPTWLDALGGSTVGQDVFQAVTASNARAALGLVIGTDVLAPSGSGASLTALNATQLTSGTVPGARLTATINAQTGTAYTLALADAGAVVTMSNASANLLTIPANATVAFPVGTPIEVRQIAAGVTTIDGDTGVTVNGVSGGAGNIAARWQGVSLLKTATDTWIASGAIGTVA